MEPAFPALPISRELNGELVYQSKGLTIRDYFAAKAMQAFVADKEVVAMMGSREFIAESAYKMAGAMMEARNAAQ